MSVVAACLAALAVALALRGAAPRPRAAPSGAPRRPGCPSPLRPRLLAVSAATLAVPLLVPGSVGWVLVGPVAAAVWWRSRRWEGAATRQRSAQVRTALPSAVDLLLATVAAGAPPADALGRIARALGGPLEEELRGPLYRLRLGADPGEVWADLARDPGLERLGTALRRASDSGAPVVDALRRLAEDLRAAQRAEVAARVRQVEVKAAAPLAACLLPAFVLVGVVPLVAGAAAGLLAG